MSPTKKSNPSPRVPPLLRNTLGLLSGPGRTATLGLLVLAAFVAWAVAVFMHVEKHIRDSPDYIVTVEKLSITPPPDWIRRDIRAEVFRTATSPERPLSILDDDVAERIALAFRLHPWVAKAKVEKKATARINVFASSNSTGLDRGSAYCIGKNWTAATLTPIVAGSGYHVGDLLTFNRPRP